MIISVRQQKYTGTWYLKSSSINLSVFFNESQNDEKKYRYSKSTTVIIRRNQVWKEI